MMPLAHLPLLALLIGLVTGLRSLAPVAVTAWCARLGRLALGGTALWFLASTPVLALLTLGALGELVVDKLPKTGARTSALGLGARFVMGGLSGAALVLGGGQTGWLTGVIFGAVGGVIGAFAGYQARRSLVKVLAAPDLFVALPEDVLSIACAILIVIRA